MANITYNDKSQSLPYNDKKFNAQDANEIKRVVNLKADISQIIDGNQSLGAWNAATNTPTLTTVGAPSGKYYEVSVAGTSSITGTSTAFKVRDKIISNGTVWQYVPRVGDFDSYASTDALNTTNTGLAATNVIVNGLTNRYYAVYNSVAEAYVGVPLALRKTGTTVAIMTGSAAVDWWWNSSNLTNDGLVPKVTASAVELVASPNLFNINDLYLVNNGVNGGIGKQINGAGDIIGYGNGTISHKIAVEAGANYTFAGGYQFVRYAQFQDAAGAKIGYAAISNGAEGAKTITIPAGTVTLQFTIKDQGAAPWPTQTRVYKGSVDLGFIEYAGTPYVKGTNNVPILAGDLSAAAQERIIPVEKISSKNLVNVYSPTVIPNASVGTSNGQVFGQTGSILSDPINVLPSTTYTISALTSPTVVQFRDANNVPLRNDTAYVYAGVNGTVKQFTTTASTYKIVFAFKTGGDTTDISKVQLEQGDQVTPYQAYSGEPYIRGRNSVPIVAARLAEGATMAGKQIATIDQIGNAYPAFPVGFTKILAVGSSITFGYGGNETQSWRYVLANSLTTALARTVTVINGGVTGQNTGGMLFNLPTLIADNTPHIVLLEGGNVNDAKASGGVSPAVTRQNINNMLDLVIASGAIPILNTSFPLDITGTMGSLVTYPQVAVVNNIVRDVARIRQIRLLDLEVLAASNMSLIQADLLHLSAAGNRYWASCQASMLLK